MKKLLHIAAMLLLCTSVFYRYRSFDKKDNISFRQGAQDMTLYQQFINLDIDFSRIGFFAEDDKYRYFCTPENGRIIGSMGVDGVHFCMVDGCGDMIFAVNPIPPGDVYVYPVAENFADFLGLVLATGSTNVLDQLYYMDRNGYDSLMNSRNNTDFITAPQHIEILQKIHRLGVQPIENPYDYVKNLQEEFDYSKIKFSDGFYADTCTDNSSM